MKNAGDVLERGEKTIGMHEVACVHFAVVKRAILLFLYLKIIKKKYNKIRMRKRVLRNAEFIYEQLIIAL